MLKTMKNVLAALFLILIFISASFAQQTATPPAAKSDDDFVTEKGFKSKVFEVKYRDAGSLATVVRPLGSGFKGASVSSNSEFKTLTVRDFPENLATIEEAIKRLDTPAAPRANIELHMYVLVASNNSAYVSDKTAQVPTELKDVLTQLRGTLNYQNYELAATVVERITESPRAWQGNGTTEVSSGNPNIPNITLPYRYVISSVSLVQNATGAPTVQINEFSFTTMNDRDNAQLQTALNLRDGEKVVVGTATIKSRALVIVLSAKLVN
jgi:type II secretory pathway component GspD/PulD (secretin)